ncbi:MAG: site-specific integrase [Actinobacteria bacterium]|nr:site-specific integrase [Actinomycetota bacterium]
MRRGSWIDLRRSSITFSDLVESWIRQNSLKRQRSLDRDLGILKLHLLPALGTRQIHTIKKTEIQHLINNWTKNGLKARTVRRHIAVLKAIFNYAINDDRLMKNPANGVTLPKPEPVERHPLSPEEASRLLAAIDPYFKPLVYIALTTGLRWSELAGLQLQDLDLDGPEPHLTVNRGLHATSDGPTYEKPKSTAGHRTLPLAAVQVAIIKAHLDSSSEHRSNGGTDPVFVTKQGRHLDYQNFTNRYFNPAVKQAGLKDVRIHDLRRTTATIMVASQVDLKTIEAWMGHSDVRLTLGVYASHTLTGLTDASTILATTLELDGQFLN